jgi:hypothetical protein
MDKGNSVLVTLNQAGIDLAENEIDSVLDLTNKSQESKREHLASHFNVEVDKLSKQMLIRYAQADKVMTRISAGSADENIRKRITETLLSIKRCYSHAEYRACIEMCALLSEMLANYLCIADKDKLTSVIENMDDSDKKIINKNGTTDRYFSDKYNQRFRLKWLDKADVLDVHDKACLLHIHDLRIKYFHHWNTDPKNAQADALDVLGRVSAVAAKYLEVLGKTPRTFNQENLDRITRYMAAVNGA